MAGVITTIFEGVGTLVKYGFWSTIGAAGLGGGYLALTKPQKETFSPYFQSLITKNEGQKTSIGERLAKWGLSKAVEKTSQFDFKDYVFYATVDVTLPDGQVIRFVGICQNWYLRD